MSITVDQMNVDKVDKETTIVNARSLPLLNAEFKILAMVLIKRLALVVSDLIKEAQMYAMLSRAFIKWLKNKYGFGRILINKKF